VENKDGEFSVVKAKSTYHLKKKSPNAKLVQKVKSRDYKRFVCKGDTAFYSSAEKV